MAMFVYTSTPNLFCSPPPPLPLVHDLTIHLEHMVSALYIYTKECHTALQAASVFPFQMELRIDSVSQKMEPEEDDVESLLP